jgi:hypothetical protein
MSFYKTLNEQTDLMVKGLGELPRVKHIVLHGMPKEEYLSLLSQLYHIVWHFVPASAAAAARCGDNYRSVRYFLYEHIAEEKGHESWILDDVAALGSNPERVRSGPRSLPVEAMWGYNYGAAEHGNPCSVLGMIYALETIAQHYALAFATSIARAIGTTPDEHLGFKFLLSHATMDAGHTARFRGWANANVSDPIAQQAVISSARVNLFLFHQLFQ